MKRTRRRWLLLFLTSLALFLLLIGLEVALGWHCDLEGQIPQPTPEPQERKGVAASIRDYSRPEADTFLSYPEWYIVWSYKEKADLQEQDLPSRFPYFGSARQFWTSSCCISRLTGGKSAFNVLVIGTSFTAEYLLKGAYEKTMGKLSEWSSGGRQVEEDRFAYQVAHSYADFVHIRPFYEFPFSRQVMSLWRNTPFWGEHLPRKWERKAFLTLDYTIEGIYSWLIEKASHLTYGYEPANTYAWIDNADQTVFEQLPRVKRVKQVGPRAFIVDIPRYQEFTGIAAALAERQVHFVEIAGNSQIIVSVLSPQVWHYDLPNGRQLFSTPVLSRPGLKRVVIQSDVPELHEVLSRVESQGITLEHVYDY